MSPMYCYQHPETGEIFEDIRSFKDMDKPYIAPDGVKCERIFVIKGLGIVDKNAECFQKDAAWVKSCNPKYVKFRDGHRERYDPNKHF